MNDQVNTLLEKALATDDEDMAIEIYLQIIDLAPNWHLPYYNLGLAYKYKGNWSKSYEYNLKATALDPSDNPSWWNLGIASTVLEKWIDARKAWNHFGLNLKITNEEVRLDIGMTPIRLKNGEVIWADRICPARARIKNIPYKASNRKYNDIILNDGAPTGKRISNGQEYPVFDELDLLQPSDFTTYALGVRIKNKESLERLDNICHNKGAAFENWTDSTVVLCKQCSEGIPHEAHDKDLPEERAFDFEYHIAIATPKESDLNNILEEWTYGSENVVNWVE